MKKVISVKEIMVILISLIILTISTNVFASGLVLGGNNSSNNDAPQQITGDQYNNAQVNNSANNTNNTSNNVANLNNNNTSLPQTGIEDYNIGILLIICIGSAIFAYKKISDYRSI